MSDQKESKERKESQGRKTPSLKMVVDGEVREISFEELTLSNNLAQEALVRLLVDKKIIDGQELFEYMQKIRTERYRTEPPSENQTEKK